MTNAAGWREQAPAYLAGAAAATSIVSIAASQILLGLALAALIANPKRLRWPPVTIPLLAWLGWTLVSLFANGHIHQGLPQVKKFYVYLMLFAVYSAIRTLAQIRWIALGWILGGALSAAWSMEQFARKYMAAKAAGQPFYEYYVGQRITGFMGHWMTFSGHMMIALMIVGALVLFRRDRKLLPWLIAAACLLTAGLLAAFTRSMWPGAALGGMYLLWFRNRWLVAMVPLLAAVILAANPFAVRERALSIVRPHDGQLDSNVHREMLRRTGWNMIEAHPFVGVGPEQVGPQFLNYYPQDAPHPIPKEWYYDHLHNIYVHFGAERGLPALAALLWMIGKALWDFARAARRDGEAKWVLHGAVAVILAVLVSGYGEVNLGDSEVLAVFLAVIACGYTAIEAQPS
jgi:O-antigen ligase